MLAKIIAGDCLKTTTNRGKNKALIIEAKETILESRKIKIQIKTRSKRIPPKPGVFQANPISTPKVVAIPLPPLKFKNIVQLWPQIQLIPIKIRKRSQEIFIGKPAICTRKIGIIPLRISKAKTDIPTFFPRTLSALVAPILPEPNFRISILLSNFPKIKAVGIEPIK